MAMYADASVSADDKLIADYLDWTEKAVGNLEKLAAMLPDGFNSGEEAKSALHAISHDIKGMGGAFGYPLMSKVGESFCAYLIELPEGACPAATITNAHVAAMRVVLEKRLTGDGGNTGDNLITQLENIAA